MKDPHQAFRTAIWGALEGQLTMDFEGSGGVVPLYDELVTTDNENTYVLMTTQTAQDRSNRSRFNHTVTQQIQIVNKTERGVDKRVVDDIANQIFEILWPTPSTDGLVQQDDFQIHSLRKQSDDHVGLNVSTTQSVIRRIITFSARVHQLATS